MNYMISSILLSKRDIKTTEWLNETTRKSCVITFLLIYAPRVPELPRQRAQTLNNKLCKGVQHVIYNYNEKRGTKNWVQIWASFLSLSQTWV